MPFDPIGIIENLGILLGSGSETDELVKVSENDTDASYLSSKLVAGANVNLALINANANEQIVISSTGEGGESNDEQIIVDFTWETVLPLFLHAVIDEGTVTRARIIIDEAFTDSQASIGIPSFNQIIFPLNENDLNAIGDYQINSNYFVADNTNIYLYGIIDGTEGIGRIILDITR
jgi:hypothetical protein